MEEHIFDSQEDLDEYNKLVDEYNELMEKLMIVEYGKTGRQRAGTGGQNNLLTGKC